MEERVISETSTTVNAIQQIIIQEIGKIELECRKFREVFKSMGAFEQRVEGRLATIAQISDALVAVQTETAWKTEEVKTQLVEAERKVNNLEGECSNIRADKAQLEVHNQRLQRYVEVDNKNCRNNLRLKGLKQGEEEGDFKRYLETLLTSCLSSAREAVVSL